VPEGRNIANLTALLGHLAESHPVFIWSGKSSALSVHYLSFCFYNKHRFGLHQEGNITDVLPV
jgi:hypothetical protein